MGGDWINVVLAAFGALFVFYNGWIAIGFLIILIVKFFVDMRKGKK